MSTISGLRKTIRATLFGILCVLIGHALPAAGQNSYEVPDAPQATVLARDCDDLREKYVQLVKTLTTQLESCNHQAIQTDEQSHGNNCLKYYGGAFCRQCQPLQDRLDSTKREQTERVRSCRANERLQQEAQERARREAEEQRRQQEAEKRRQAQAQQRALEQRQQDAERVQRESDRRVQAAREREQQCRDAINSQYSALQSRTQSQINMVNNLGNALAGMVANSMQRQQAQEDRRRAQAEADAADRELQRQGEEAERQRREQIAIQRREQQQRDVIRRQELDKSTRLAWNDMTEKQDSPWAAPPVSVEAKDSPWSSAAEIAHESGRSLMGEVVRQIKGGKDVDIKTAAQEAIRSTLVDLRDVVKDQAIRYTISRLPDNPKFEAETIYFTFVNSETRMLSPIDAMRNVKRYFEEMVGKPIDQFLSTQN